MIACYIEINIAQPVRARFGNPAWRTSFALPYHLASKQILCLISKWVFNDTSALEYTLSVMGSWEILHSAFAWFNKHKHVPVLTGGSSFSIHATKRVLFDITVPDEWVMKSYKTTDSISPATIPSNLGFPATLRFMRGDEGNEKRANQHFSRTLWLYTEDESDGTCW